ncbi:uncharacterized protein METZ01_LOCUS132535 [marine metagenome]|uniref:Uncharacterized protein n=1 Tax=marine metagenome TaxID=408172 RepID=A0A381YSS4_9ZZZZ
MAFSLFFQGLVADVILKKSKFSAFFSKIQDYNR